MFKIVVCVKAVPDPKRASEIKIDPRTKTLTRAAIPLVMNQLDKHAMEAALTLKKQQGGEITVISMGPPPASAVVRECLAMGADHGALLSDRAFGGADAYATAYTLAAGIEKIGAADLVLCGMASSDGSTEWVGPQLSVFLDLPVITEVTDISKPDGEWWQIKAHVDNGYRLLKVRLPAVLAVTRELNKPRAISFSGIIKARKKEILTWDLDALGKPASSLGLSGSPTIISDLRTSENKREVELIEGTREEKADLLVRKLAAAGLL
ncbi:MAG: electron transfer flavoprotein subunit beta/FixA family protein [Pseudomonadota bacterium]|nr:electron transfer flavoprotein subunit beta/FixA family protein [Pseudomonadota bacterium]